MSVILSEVPCSVELGIFPSDNEIPASYVGGGSNGG